MSFNFPSEIKNKIKDEYEERKNKLDPTQQKILAPFLDFNQEIDGDISVLNDFLDVVDNNIKSDFINLIENFDDLESYRKFLASVLIYLRIEDIGDECDKFLYLCIAIEAATRFKYNQNKGKALLFKKFFKDNLPIEDRIHIISKFESKEFKYTVSYVDLIRYRANPKIKPKKIETNDFLPSCYRRNHCYLQYGSCIPKYGCYLTDKANTDGYFDLVLDFLYQKRSNFVHEGKIFPHPTSGNSIPFVCYDSANKTEIGVQYSLDLFDLFKIYQKALLNHFK